MPNLPDILNGVQEAAGANPVTRTKNIGKSVKTAGFPNFFMNTYFYKTSSDLRYCYSIATLLYARIVYIPAKFFEKYLIFLLTIIRKSIII